MLRKLAITVAASAIAVPFLAASASATNKPDPCPGEHIAVYNEKSNTELPHFVCAGDLKGEKGETGPQGPKGEDGKDGIDGKDGKDGVDGKDGIDGEKGEKGDPGAPGADGDDSVVPGPVGPTGDVGPAGPAGVPGAPGAVGLTGAQGERGKPGVSRTIVITKNADGTESREEVDSLPNTGSDGMGTEAAIALLGLGLIGVGIAAYRMSRRDI